MSEEKEKKLQEINWAKLRKEISDFLIITEENVLHKNLEIPSFYHRMLSIFIAETQKYQKLKLELEFEFGKLWDLNKKSSAYDYKISELEYIINSDVNYNKLRIKAMNQKIIAEYMENAIKCISQMSYNINNYKEIKKHLDGN